MPHLLSLAVPTLCRICVRMVEPVRWVLCSTTLSQLNPPRRSGILGLSTLASCRQHTEIGYGSNVMIQASIIRFHYQNHPMEMCACSCIRTPLHLHSPGIGEC